MMKVFKNREDWLDYRRPRIGASDAAIVLGKSDFMTPAQLYYQKVEGVKYEETRRLQMGHECEDFVARCFEEDFDCKLTDPGDFTVFPSPDHDWLFATPDRMGEDEDGKFLVELKTVHPQRSYLFRDGTAPDAYLIQTQVQMLCTGIDRAYIYAMEGLGDNFFNTEVRLNERFIQAILPHLEKFVGCMQSKELPELTMEEADQKIWEALHQQDNGEVLDWRDKDEDIASIIEEWQSHSGLEGAHKKRKEALARRIKRMLGDATYASDGDHWVSYKTQKSKTRTTRVLRYHTKAPAGVKALPEQETEDE